MDPNLINVEGAPRPNTAAVSARNYYDHEAQVVRAARNRSDPSSSVYV
jgi:hypothetical protein